MFFTITTKDYNIRRTIMTMDKIVLYFRENPLEKTEHTAFSKEHYQRALNKVVFMSISFVGLSFCAFFY